MVGKTLVHDGAVHLVDSALLVLPGTETPKDAAFAEAEKGARAASRKPTGGGGGNASTEIRRNLVRTALGINPKA